ncbi:MAG: molybdopterin-dependent oxidoreductase [Desulfobacteraceae bacterium]|nr:molybdopterin-dependent oxidoreductase [Desulfobacteraceae bacterium]
MSQNTQIYKSACRMCHGGCGVLVHVKDDKVIKVTGDPESPLNKGKMCPKGLASIEHLYHPDRLKYPLKRAGKRGAGKWERISWNEALDSIAENITAIKETYGIEAVAVGTGTGRHHFRHVARFAHALGTPNWCEPGLAQCFIPRIHASVMTYGGLPVCDYYGEVNPACVLVWGHNPVVSGPDGEIQFRAKECLKKGTTLIVVDPRRTSLAEQADIWLQLRPGTDDALALAMLNVIINENIYDKEFVEEWTVGFDQLAKRVDDYTPDWAEDITEVPAEKVKAAARLFADTRPATLEWGVAIEQTPNCFQTVRAVALLPGITGNIDVPGGWIFGMGVMSEVSPLIKNLPEETRTKRLGAEEFRVLSGVKSFFPSAHVPTLFKAMRTGEPYPVKAFLIFGNNGLVSYANSKQVYESLMSLDFMAVMDLYMTPTAELADIVLPAASWLEVDEIVGLPYIAHNVVLVQQKIVRVGECRQDEEVFIQLARKLNLKAGTEPPESPVSAPDLVDEFPLVLTTGGRSQYFFHTEYRQIRSLRKRDPEPLVEIHPKTAKAADIQDGDWVWIETLRGRIMQKAKVTDGIKPNVVNVQHGWWFPEEPAPDFGLWKSNANVLTSNAPPYDPAMGTYQLRALLCKIYKADQ